MASNGRLGLRSGSPSFLVIGLSLVIVVLLYSYWSVSSRNNMLLRDQSLLQERLRTLTSQKIKVEHKYSAARSQTTDLERAKRKLEEKDVTSSNHKSRLDSKIKELESEIRVEKQKFLKTKSEGVKSKSELFKLKSEIDTTHEKFKTMNSKADSLMVMHKKLQDTVKAQSHELLQTKNDREVLRVQLEQAKVESHHIQPKPNLQKPAGPLGAQRKQVPGKKPFGHVLKFNPKLKPKEVIPGLVAPRKRFKVGQEGRAVKVNFTKPSILSLSSNNKMIKLNSLDPKPNKTVAVVTTTTQKNLEANITAMSTEPNNTVMPGRVAIQDKRANVIANSTDTLLKPTTVKALSINATKPSNTSMIGQQNVAAKQALDVKTSNSSEATPTLSSVVVADKHKITQQPSEKPTAVSTMEKTKRGKPIEGEDPNARQVRFDKKTRFGQQEE